MSQIIYLQNEKARLTLDPQGAYVTDMQDAYGFDIIFPKQTIDGKIRGGVPLCAPIFGPGDSAGIPQHGFARNLEWKIARQTAYDAELVLEKPAEQMEQLEGYAGCAMQYTVSLDGPSVHFELKVGNTGDKPFICSPGIHPYFTMFDATLTPIAFPDAAKKFSAQELLATVFPESPHAVVCLKVGSRTVMLSSLKLRKYAIWTDNPAKYLCIEPTLGGYLEHQNLADIQLQPGASETYSMQIEWK